MGFYTRIKNVILSVLRKQPRKQQEFIRKIESIERRPVQRPTGESTQKIIKKNAEQVFKEKNWEQIILESKRSALDNVEEEITEMIVQLIVSGEATKDLPDLADSTWARKRRTDPNAKMLIDTEDMINSIRSHVNDDGSISIGFDSESEKTKAIRLVEGTDNMPPRDFMKTIIEKLDRDAIAQLVGQEFKKELVVRWNR